MGDNTPIEKTTIKVESIHIKCTTGNCGRTFTNVESFEQHVLQRHMGQQQKANKHVKFNMS